MTWTRVRISDICDTAAGGTPSRTELGRYFGGDIPWVKSGELKENLIQNTEERITRLGLDESAAKIVPAGALLVALYGATVGRIATLGIDAATNQAVCSIVPKSNLVLDGRFLFYALRESVPIWLSRRVGGAQPNISQQVIKETEIPLPPLSEQRRIAAVLDAAEALRAKCRAAFALLDTLTQAIFTDMFGNPIRNEREWPLTTLREVSRVDRGKFTPRPRGDPSYYGGPYPFIQTGDISASGGRLNSWSQTLNEKGVKVSRSFPPGTVVIAIVGATLGVTAILDIEVYCPDSVVGIQAHAFKTSAEYIEQVLRFWRPIFVAQAPETARANINLETLRPLQIPLPPFDLQQEFARRITLIERMKASHRSSLAQLDTLFASLQHRAFRGEL